MTREEAISHIKDVICENNTIKPNIAVFEQEKEALYMAIKALELIPDNATNIDVIKSLFPKGSHVKGAAIYIMDDKRSNLNYDVDWGNAPYRKD